MKRTSAKRVENYQERREWHSKLIVPRKLLCLPKKEKKKIPKTHHNRLSAGRAYHGPREDRNFASLTPWATSVTLRNSSPGGCTLFEKTAPPPSATTTFSVGTMRPQRCKTLLEPLLLSNSRKTFRALVLSIVASQKEDLKVQINCSPNTI